MSNSETHYDEVTDLLRSFTHRRISRVIMYLMLSLGALFSLFSPSQILLNQSSSGLTLVWTILFSLAALTCFVGSLMDRWMYEYIMIPLLASILVVFGVALFTSAYMNQTGLVIPYAMFFGAFAFGLFARWKDVQSLLRVTISLQKEREPDE